MTKTFSASIISSIFAGICLVSTLTFIVPLLTIIPASVFLESFYKDYLKTDSYYEIVPMVLKSLWGIFLFSTVSFYLYCYSSIKKNRNLKKSIFITFLILQLFILHPLVFFIDTSSNWGRASDGQFIMGIIKTFPISSFLFVVFGLVLDVLRNNNSIEINKEKKSKISNL